MLYSFKQKSQDFIVEEVLPFKLAWEGDAFFVYFEKRNLNTMDVVNHLCKEFGISRLTLGIAGLKDKNAITRQWISIYKSALKKIWGENAFVNALSEVARVIKTDWHEKPIGMTDKISNMFYIRLRANQAIGLKDKENIQKRVTELLEKWFPNFFGDQRFWINFQNINMGRDLIEGKLKIRENFEAKFKLQAYASHLFNEYLKERLKGALAHGGKDLPITEGETWPIFGYDNKLSPAGTVAAKREIAFMKQYKIGKEFFAMYEKYHIFWLRRLLRVCPKDILFRFQGDDILLQFALPWGTYASILVDELLKITK